MCAQQAIALDQAVALQVPDHGLDGVAPAQLSPDRGETMPRMCETKTWVGPSSW